MKKFVRSLTAVAAAVLGSASFAATATPTADHIVLGLDWNQPTRCADGNADSLAISEAKVGTELWQSVNDSKLYGWGFFGSSMATPPDVGGVPFFDYFPTMRRWYRYGDGPDQPMADRTPYNPPNANYDYWIGSAGLCTPNDGSVDSHFGANHVYKFEGRSLTIDGTIVHCSKGKSICDFGDNVTIKGACTYSFPALGNSIQPVTRATAKVEGTLKFEAGTGMSNELQIPTYLDWSLTGGADAKVQFTQMIQSGKPCTAKWFWCGDCSGFTGRFVLNNATATSTAYSILAISNSVVNGTVEIQKYERLQLLGDDAFVARAEIAEGATLDVESGHTTRIGTLVLDGKMNFAARTSKLGLTDGLTFGPDAQVLLAKDIEGAIITMPSSEAFDVEDFVAALQRGNGAARTIAAKIVDNGDGTKSVVVLNPGAVANGTLIIDEDLSIAGGDAKYRVSVAAGKTLDLINCASRMAVELKDNATLNIRRRFEDWSTLPTLWLDASVDTSISNVVVIYENSTYNYNVKSASGCYLKMDSTVTDTLGNPLVKGWFDWRPDRQEYRIWNSRYERLYEGYNAVMAALYPRRIKGGLNGMDYLTFDLTPPPFRVTFTDDTTQDVTDKVSGNARAYVVDYQDDVTSESQKSVAPRYAFVVFGSQLGGGDCLLGNNSNFVRAGTSKKHTASDPIFASNAKGATVWLDGEQVDPLTTGFDGGWQVVTVDYKNVANGKFSTLGHNDGQNYAEVIIIEQELTERQRQTIEIYLAEKWGLAGKYHYPEWAKDPFATVYGAGTVKLEANATLGGAFKGTVDLNGNDLVIDGAALPPTEEAVNTDSCIGWFDPDDEKTLVTQQVNGKVPSKRLNWINDKIRGSATGALALHSRQNTRAAGIDRSAHGMGPVRTWLDYANLEGSANYTGCLSGLRVHTGEKAFGGDLQGGTNVNTMIMVIDSRRGGGNPFFDGSNVNTDDGVVKKRAKKRASDPIYPSGTGAILTEGKTYLDGIEVDGTTQGFSARAEVLSVVPHGNYPLLSFAMLGNSEKEELCGDDKSYAEIEGEILLWTRALPDAERKVVEAYLSYKWLGLANEGYSDLTAATVTGAGKVTAANAALLPKFGAGFTGTVAVPLTDGLAFTLVTDAATTVSGAIDLGGGALEIPAGGTSIGISVAKSGAKPKAGSYKLIGWASKPAVTWNLSLDGWTRESCALRVADDGLYLDLEKVGMTVIIR